MIRGLLLGAVLLSSACMSKNHPATATALEAFLIFAGLVALVILMASRPGF